MKKENPWLPMYRPKINISGISITECVSSLKIEKEMTLLDDPGVVLGVLP